MTKPLSSLCHLGRKRNMLIRLFTTIICLIEISGCRNQSIENENGAKYDVFHPILIDTSLFTENIADIHSVQNIELRTRIPGFIEKIYVDEGKPVKQGQTLFLISNLNYKEELLKAEAVLKNSIADAKVSEVEYKNTKKLVEQNIVSASELEMAQAKLDALKAEIEQSKSALSMAHLVLSYTQIKAPFSGTINRIPLKTGSLVQEGSLLTTLTNSDEVFAYFNLGEKDYLNLFAGKNMEKIKKIDLLMANDVLHPFPGKIETAETEVDRNTGNIAIRARFSNPDHLLKHGSSGKIRIMREIKNALLIPQKSSFEIQDKIFVFVLDTNNIIQSRQIQIGFRVHHFFSVISGISQKDRVLFEGFQHVKDGDQIEPKLMNWDQLKTLVNQE